MFKRKNLINKAKNEFKKNKFAIFATLGCFAAFTIPISIYFTQTAYFYNMDKVEKKEFNNFDTIYSYNASISSRYRRKIPSTYKTNIPLEKYAWYNNPWYKNNKSNTTLIDSARAAIIEESKWMMDDNYLKEQSLRGTLKKHQAADYQHGYAQRVPNDALAVVKNFNVDLQRAGTLTTGLYISAGEIVKINFKNLTDEQVKKLNVDLIIADNEHDNYNETNVKLDRNWHDRMPILRKVVKIDKSYFEFGTPFGGIVNLLFTGNPLDDLTNIGVSIKGAIETLHYVHGYTTEEEWYRLVKEAKGPIAEIASDFVSFIAPKHLLSNFRRANDKTPPPNPVDPKWYPYKAMNLFNNMAIDGHYVLDRTQNKIPKFRFLTTSYVQAGAAYALAPYLIVQPWSWVENILNYDAILNNGSWGIMHEMNHHNQSAKDGQWGFTATGESTNNVITLASYIDFANVLSNRDGLETYVTKYKDGDVHSIPHEHKINGYLSQSHINRVYYSGRSGQNKDDGFDTDYSVIMANFGTKGFHDITRTFNNPTINNAFGDNLDLGDFKVNQVLRKSAQFADRISQITGYNWSQYYLDTNLITESDAQLINDHLNKIYTNDSTKKFKPYMPLYSFYATNVKYDATSNWTQYRKVAAPFLIGKKYFEKGYIFKLEELLETSRKINNSTQQSEKDFYTISNVKLIGENAKYGTMTKNQNSSGKLEYIYKPNLEKINEIDEFEFSADVVRNISNGTKDLLQSQNEKITVNFKVKIRLEGNKTEIEVPNNLSFQLYKPDSLISEHDKLENIEMENPMVNGKPIHKYWSTLTEKNLLNKYPSAGFQVEPDKEDIVVNLTFKDYTNINSITLYNAVDGHDVVDGIRIEDITNSNNPKKLLEQRFLKQDKVVYNFQSVNTKKIKITFLKQLNGMQVSANGWIKIKRLDLGLIGKGNKILPVNSSLIQTVGDWRKGFGGSRYNKDSLMTINPFTSIYFGIRNTDSLSILGAKDVNYGSFDIYINNKFYKTINASSSYRLDNIPLSIIPDIKKNFGENNDHIIKLVSKSSKPIEIQGINIEENGEVFNPNISDPYYILVSVIPIVSIILVVASIVTAFVLIIRKRKVAK